VGYNPQPFISFSTQYAPGSHLQATAVAHPNIALVKYWGKRDAPGNRPAVPSISITLDTLETRTRVRFDPALTSDQFTINDEADPRAAGRAGACLDTLRRLAGRRAWAAVETWNNFPTGAGLASSASGFAALVVAADRALGLNLGRDELSRLARRSSGSAARSLYGGFVELPLDAREETARPLLPAPDWPLSVVIAVTETEAKDVGSTEGMQRTAQTSDYYGAWLDTAQKDFQTARDAILARDFRRLGKISEKSCLKMHGLMLSADPGIIYWNEATVACLHRVRALRAQGIDVYFTMDAGPQVKAVCLPESREAVTRALEGIPGVSRVLECGLGAEARIVETT
jgi:diphosphomevalonate decarboxylase